MATATPKRRGFKKKRTGARRAKSAADAPVVMGSRKVARWGNSLGLRIPQEAADLLKLEEGGEVSIEVHNGTIVVRPERKKWTEADLLKGVTPEIVGGEVNWGGAVGREVW